MLIILLLFKDDEDIIDVDFINTVEEWINVVIGTNNVVIGVVVEIIEVEGDIWYKYFSKGDILIVVPSQFWKMEKLIEW